MIQNLVEKQIVIIEEIERIMIILVEEGEVGVEKKKIEEKVKRIDTQRGVEKMMIMMTEIESIEKRDHKNYIS